MYYKYPNIQNLNSHFNSQLVIHLRHKTVTSMIHQKMESHIKFQTSKQKQKNKISGESNLPSPLSDWTLRRSVVVLPANIGPTITWISPDRWREAVSICIHRFWTEEMQVLGTKRLGFGRRRLGFWKRVGGLNEKDLEAKDERAKGVVLEMWGTE